MFLKILKTKTRNQDLDLEKKIENDECFSTIFKVMFGEVSFRLLPLMTFLDTYMYCDDILISYCNFNLLRPRFCISTTGNESEQKSSGISNLSVNNSVDLMMYMYKIRAWELLLKALFDFKSK